jgi:hypothetical protein
MGWRGWRAWWGDSDGGVGGGFCGVMSWFPGGACFHQYIAGAARVHTGRWRGLGHLGNGTFTSYDAEAAQMRAEEAKKDPDAPLDLGWARWTRRRVSRV